MRRYAFPDGSWEVTYAPGDPVLVNLGDRQVWGRVMSEPRERQQPLSDEERVQQRFHRALTGLTPNRERTETVYRVSIEGCVQVIRDRQIVKQADNGGLRENPVGFVRHVE